MGKSKKMLHEYVVIVMVIGIALICSFVIIKYIATSSTMEQSRQSASVIYKQAMEQLNQIEEDINNLRFNIMSNDSTLTFMETGDFTTRWDELKSVQIMVGNNRRINKYLKNIILYDKNENLCFALGDIFPKKIDIDWNKTLTYSGGIWDSNKENIYFEVGMPIFIKSENGRYKNIGSAYFIFIAENLQMIMNHSLLNENSSIALVDQENNVIVKAGTWNDNYTFLTSEKEDKKRLVYVEEIGNTGWRLINVISKKALLTGVAQLLRIMYITYICVIITMAFLCFMIYCRIIRPITRQTAFMETYVKDTKQRIKVIDNNEIGEMAQKMNQMLDDIEDLNQQIIDSNHKYLEMKYAKKQTEIIAFRSQINPHFLANTFECIRGMALNHDEREIADLTKSLSKIFRYNVKGEEIVSVLEELNNLQEYAKIIEYRFCGKYKIIVESHRDVFLYKIPKMILQPIVENAVFHGLETKGTQGSVQVNIWEEERTLHILVMDDGKGIPQMQLQKLQEAMNNYDEHGIISDNLQGIGFMNVYRRLHLFYAGKAKLLLESKEEKGTKITLIVPKL